MAKLEQKINNFIRDQKKIVSTLEKEIAAMEKKLFSYSEEVDSKTIKETMKNIEELQLKLSKIKETIAKIIKIKENNNIIITQTIENLQTIINNRNKFKKILDTIDNNYDNKKKFIDNEEREQYLSFDKRLPLFDKKFKSFIKEESEVLETLKHDIDEANSEINLIIS